MCLCLLLKPDTPTTHRVVHKSVCWLVKAPRHINRKKLHCVVPAKRFIMSLVGLNVSIDTAGGVSFEGNDSYDEVDRDEQHPSVTPPSAAELLFLSDLPTQSISAAALAQQIHISHSQRSGYSVATEDFATAAGTVSSDMMLLSPAPTSNCSPSSNKSPLSDTSEGDESFLRNSIFSKDVLTQNYSITEQEDEFQDSRMSSTSTNQKFFPTEAPQHVDAAEKVYDTAKGVWAWGKGVGIVKPFLGIAEGIAGKVADMTGNTLEGVDGIVVDKLHGLDDNLLNPAIAAIVGILLNAAGKSEDVLKPILLPVLKQFKLIKETAENPELTTAPGVTVQ